MTPNRGSWIDVVDARLDEIRTAGRWRSPRDVDGHGPTGALATDGRPVIAFAANDYLGLSAHPDVAAAAHRALDRWGAGAGAARLVTGSRPVHTELEHELAAWKGTERAVLFSTGYAANLGVLATLAGDGVTVVSDALNHASIVDGCRVARANGAEVVVTPHADADAVADAAQHAAAAGARIIIVTDAVFSMDGDVAPIDRLLATAAAHAAIVVLDEAHVVPGLAPELLDEASVDAVDRAGGAVLRVGTLSKTLGALGGFVAGPRRFTELLVNSARPYIFTTASTPADAAAALAALQIVRSAEGRTLAARLREHIDRLAVDHSSPIIPIVLGKAERAVAAAAALLDRGLLVPAIRPPTVPPGESRLRITLSAAHTDMQVDRLLDGLATLGWHPATDGVTRVG